MTLVVLLVAGCGAAASSGPPASASSSTPSPAPSPSPTPILLTRAQAESIARLASARFAKGDLLETRLGRYSEFANGHAVTATPIPGPDGMVWWINLGTNPGPLMGQGEFFVIDAIDGHVIQHDDWIS